MTEKYYKPIQKELEYYFYELYWKDILKLLEESKKLYNSKSALISAIRTGKIQYRSGIFSGKFNVSISKELSKYAKYDKRTKTWKGMPPAAVIAAATVANDRGRQLADQIERLIADIPSRVEDEIANLKYSIDNPLFMMSAEAEKDLTTLGISVDMTQELSDRLTEDYTTNMNLNVVNWSDEEVVRLREMIQKNALSGYNRLELQQLIANEYNVSMNKAKFLARQETSLFLTTVRDERYKEGGVKYVKWSTSQDNRVVGKPGGLYPEGTPGHGNHYGLNGKICRLDDPTVYADTIEDAKKGKWKSKITAGFGNRHAGQEWNCRCTYLPLKI